MNSPDIAEQSDAIVVRGDVAIIGMACLFPGAPDVDTFWHNIVNKIDAITDVPPERWDPAIFFDPHSDANDRVYSKRGGYLTYSVCFNPADVGVIPITAIHGEPEQFLALLVAQGAMADAGYLDRTTNQDRTEVVLGRGNYLNRGILTMMQHVRGAETTLRMIKSFRPDLTEDELQEIKAEIKASLPIFNADTASTLIPNLTTGRIANRLDLMGANFTVDAACASSLVAAEIGVRDLLTRKCDLALVGGIYVSTDVGFQSIFCQLHALSRNSQIRPFDADADGLLLGEGAGCIVLKRLEDAERDGDRVYAVIKGVGTSSDGRGLGVLAPRVEGEELALRRAYEMARLSPRTVELIEAHGTATLAGDIAEVQALSRVFGDRDGPLPWCGLGSIKSMIGHLMPAAGIAGLIKATLSLYHRTLPPTLNCGKPNPRLELEKTPFYINTETRPWIHGSETTPRRMGVNAFGFGGINGHVVLEEYSHTDDTNHPSHLLHWETEVCIVQADTRQELTEQLHHLQRYLEGAPQVALKDLAYTLNIELRKPYRMACVASSLADLSSKVDLALERLSDPKRRQIKDREGIYFFEEPLSQDGKLAFLFPGVGAAYVNMLWDLCLHFPEARRCFDLADQLFTPRTPLALLPSQLIYPAPHPSQQEAPPQRRLWQEDGVLEAIYAADGALSTILTRLGIRPDMMVGHSFGDLFSLLFGASPEAPREVVLDAMAILEHLINSGIHTYEELRLEEKIPQHVALLNVGADSVTVSNLFESIDGPLYISMDNCPHQVVVIGEKGAVARLIAVLKRQGIFYEELPFNKPAYHTPLFEVARGPLEDYQWTPPLHTTEVYSCTTASPYPKNPSEVRQLSVEHWMRRVEFRKTIEAMYEAKARIFVEVGPGGILTAFVDDILRGRPYLAVASNVLRRSGITQLNHLVAMLASQRIPMSFEYLYERRAPRRLTLNATEEGPTNGHHNRGMVDLALLGTPTMKLSRRIPTETEARLQAPTVSEQLEPVHPEAPRAGKVRTKPAQATEGVQTPPSSGPGWGTAPDTGEARDQAIPEPDPLTPGNVPPRADMRTVMQSYLQTMDMFLETQERVMHSVMTRPQAIVPVPHRPSQLSDQSRQSSHAETQDWPFVGKIISIIPAQEVVVQRQLTMSDDLFLHDHVLGGQVSDVDASLAALPVVPMTAAMEIMAEAAALLAPQKLLIAMQEIQTYQWIDLDEGHTTLQITARRRTAEQLVIEVRIYNLGVEETDNSGKGNLAIQGVVIFGDATLESPQVKPLHLTSPRSTEFTAEEIYTERLMFHGPRFQGVASLEKLAEEGLVGQLQVLPTHNLFRSIAQPRLLTDFALLDASGQLVGYWGLESVATGKVMFPLRLDALHIYGPPVRAGQWVECQVRMREVHEKYMRADLDILYPDGRLWMRLQGWCDWRFYCPEEAYEFFRFPKEIVVSTPLASPLARFPLSDRFECCLAKFDEMFSRDAVAFWLKAWSRLLLNHQERREFSSLGGPEQRQVEWLLGRIAAKDAIRTLFKKQHGISVHPADIAIANDEHGRLTPRGYWLQAIGYTPALSISPSGHMAIAIAGRCIAPQCLGVNVRLIEPRSRDFEETSFTSHERSFLDSIGNAIRQEWLTRFWCAKEAVANALGQGLSGGPQSVLVKGVDAASGLVKVALGDKLASEFLDLAGVPMAIYTTRHRELVIASTLCERA